MNPTECRALGRPYYLAKSAADVLCELRDALWDLAEESDQLMRGLDTRRELAAAAEEAQKMRDNLKKIFFPDPALFETDEDMPVCLALARRSMKGPNESATWPGPGLGDAYDLEQYEKAIADHDEAIRLNPDDANAYLNRGDTKLKQPQFEAAIADFDEAIRLNPDDANAYLNRGDTKLKQPQFEAAIADFDEAIRLNPDDANAYSARGYANWMLGQYEAAVTDYDQAIRLRPNAAVAYFARGDAKGALKLKDEARKDFETALKLARKEDFNADLLAAAEQSLRNLDGSVGS